MINFKLSLLTPVFDDRKNTFLQTIITDFRDQIATNKEKQNSSISYTHYEYTFNEHFSEEENNHKTLTFSMNQKATVDNAIYDNPFINFLHVGSLILYEDRYDNHHLFYINNISYDFQEVSTIYKYTCQDAFSYLLTKQKSDYTINNDASTADYMGALSIDD